MRPGSPARGATWPSRSAASTSSSCRRRRRDLEHHSRGDGHGAPRGRHARSAAIPSWSWRKTGTLVPSSDPAALAGAIARYAGVPSSPRTAAGRARACAEFSLAGWSRYADLYDAGVRHPGVLDDADLVRDSSGRRSRPRSSSSRSGSSSPISARDTWPTSTTATTRRRRRCSGPATGSRPATTGRSRSTTRPSSSSSWPGRSCSSGCATTPRSSRRPLRGALRGAAPRARARLRFGSFAAWAAAVVFSDHAVLSQVLATRDVRRLPPRSSSSSPSEPISARARGGRGTTSCSASSAAWACSPRTCSASFRWRSRGCTWPGAGPGGIWRASRSPRSSRC